MHRTAVAIFPRRRPHVSLLAITSEIPTAAAGDTAARHRRRQQRRFTALLPVPDTTACSNVSILNEFALCTFVFDD